MMFQATRQGLQATSLVYCQLSFPCLMHMWRDVGIEGEVWLIAWGGSSGTEGENSSCMLIWLLSPAHTLWGYRPARCTSALARLRLLCRTCSLRRRVWCRNLYIYIYIYIYTYVHTYYIYANLDIWPIISQIIYNNHSWRMCIATSSGGSASHVLLLVK